MRINQQGIDLCRCRKDTGDLSDLQIKIKQV